MEWRNIYRGLLIGAIDVVPGVSGGTIAFMLGIYSRLIASINGVFTKEWRKQLQFLVPLGIGIVCAIYSISHVMSWLLLHYPQQTYYFFMGLIIGILPFLFRASDAKNTFKWYHILLLIIGVLFISSLPMNIENGVIIEERNLNIYFFLFFAGFLASAAMILPGISGSFVLVVIGVYGTVIQAVSSLEWRVIVVVGLGICIGIITTSKIVHYFLNHYRTATYALIIGLVGGSVVAIFPGWANSFLQIGISLLVFTAGLLTAYLLGKVEY